MRSVMRPFPRQPQRPVAGIGRVTATTARAGMARVCRYLGGALQAAIVASATPDAAAAPGRWALVVGNATYPVDPLPRAVADAQLMTDELLRARFDVAMLRNGSRSSLLGAVQALAERARDGGDLVFYFAGYGLQVAGGDYLVPIDVGDGSPTTLMRESLSLAEVLDVLAGARPRQALIVIDACRTNPLVARSGALSVAGQDSPLPRVRPGQLLVLPAERGQFCLEEAPTGARADSAAAAASASPDRAVAPPRSSANGVFARELAARLRQPETSLQSVIEGTRDAVAARATAVRHNQRPVIADGGGVDLVLYPTSIVAAPSGSAPGIRQRLPIEAADDPAPRTGDAPPTSPSAVTPPTSAATGAIVPGAPATTASAPAPSALSPAQAEAEDQAWRMVSEARTVEAMDAYLREYPAGRYAAPARVQREVLAAVARRQVRDPSASPGLGSAARSSSSTAVSPAGDPAELTGRRFVASADRYQLDIVFEADGARIRRFTGPPVGAAGQPGFTAAPDAAGTGDEVPIRCGAGDRLQLVDQAKMSARCHFDDANRTALDLWGTVPRIRLESGGGRGITELELREVR